MFYSFHKSFASASYLGAAVSKDNRVYPVILLYSWLYTIKAQAVSFEKILFLVVNTFI